jgi:hypothetical protein
MFRTRRTKPLGAVSRYRDRSAAFTGGGVFIYLGGKWAMKKDQYGASRLAAGCRRQVVEQIGDHIDKPPRRKYRRLHPCQRDN